MTESTALTGLGEELLAQAHAAHSGRAAATVHGNRHLALRQTVIALVDGAALSEHESPGEATLQVLTGRVRLTSGSGQWEGDAGGLAVIPPQRHALEALGDAVVLLTVVKGV